MSPNVLSFGPDACAAIDHGNYKKLEDIASKHTNDCILWEHAQPNTPGAFVNLAHKVAASGDIKAFEILNRHKILNPNAEFTKGGKTTTILQEALDESYRLAATNNPDDLKKSQQLVAFSRHLVQHGASTQMGQWTPQGDGKPMVFESLADKAKRNGIDLTAPVPVPALPASGDRPSAPPRQSLADLVAGMKVVRVPLGGDPSKKRGGH